MLLCEVEFGEKGVVYSRTDAVAEYVISLLKVSGVAQSCCPRRSVVEDYYCSHCMRSK